MPASHRCPWALLAVALLWVLHPLLAGLPLAHHPVSWYVHQQAASPLALQPQCLNSIPGPAPWISWTKQTHLEGRSRLPLDVTKDEK